MNTDSHTDSNTHRSHDGRGHGGSPPDSPLETVNELNEGRGRERDCANVSQVGGRVYIVNEYEWMGGGRRDGGERESLYV